MLLENKRPARRTRAPSRAKARARRVADRPASSINDGCLDVALNAIGIPHVQGTDCDGASGAGGLRDG